MSTQERQLLDAPAESANAQMFDGDQPKQMAYRVIRYKSATLAISRPPIFHGPLDFNNKHILVEFKARAQRQGGRNRIDYKAGLAGSESRYLQGIQAGISAIIPGNQSVYRSPVRSRVFSALTPGGGNIPGPKAIAGTSRGYRCPEGYQYGGRFTDSRFSTCGQKLFEIAGALGQAISQIINQATRQPSISSSVSAQNVNFQDVPGNVIASRAPQIPRVGNENVKAYSASSKAIVDDMISFAKAERRLVRRDGFALTPVVSTAVLRTVPDNRDMEGANYIQFVDKPSLIGTDDEIGLLSNTGIRKLTYVLPGGSTISIEKSRTLTVGERRKLGRTIKTLAPYRKDSDPAAHLKALAAEMGSGIAYNESFNIENPNDIIDAVIPGTSNIKQVRRWYYESYLRSAKGKKPDRSEIGSQETAAKPIEEKITNIQNAIRHLNNNGDIEKIDSQIVAEAIRRSRIYKQRKMKNGFNAYDKADGQTLIEIPATTDFEHIGASVNNEIQTYLGLLSPKIVVSGSGKRRPYFIQESIDVAQRAKLSRETSSDANNYQDMLRIAVSDFVTDTRNRDISTIVPVITSGEQHALTSINRNSSLSGLSPSALKRRKELELINFYSAEYRRMMEANFAKRSEAQKRIALKLFDAMLTRLKQYDLEEMAARLAIDGNYTQAEKSHINLVKELLASRIERLSTSKSIFAELLGLKT